MAVNFADEVKRYGSVAAAREALGFTQNASGAWQAPADVEQRAAAAAAAKANEFTTKVNSTPAHKAMYDAAANNDWDRVGVLGNGLAVDAGYGDGTKSMKDANEYINMLAKEFAYDPNEYYKGKYEAVFGQGSWDGNSGGRMGLTTGSRGNGYSGYGNFGDFVNGMGYDDYEEQTRKYIQAAVDNAVNGYNRQIDTVNRDTQELARQAYIANMMGQKNMDQQLSASGLAGGMADSQRIGLQANYENNLNELEMQRQATVAELQYAIENARLTGDMQTAQELAGYLQQLQGQWVNYIQNQQQMENQNYWNNLNMQQENQNTARNWVLTMIQNGTLPDEATLTAAGMTTAEAQNMLNYVRQQNAPKVAPTPKYTETQAGLALMALANGSTDPTAIDMVETVYGLPWQTVLQSQGGTPGVIPAAEPTDEGGMQSKYYKTYENSILQTAQNGYADNAAGMVDAIWNQLNGAQRTTLQQKLAALGLEYQP